MMPVLCDTRSMASLAVPSKPPKVWDQLELSAFTSAAAWTDSFANSLSFPARPEIASFANPANRPPLKISARPPAALSLSPMLSDVSSSVWSRFSSALRVSFSSAFASLRRCW